MHNMTFEAQLDSSGLHMNKFALITAHSNIFSDSMKVTHRKSVLLDKLSTIKKTEDLPLASQYDYDGNLSESIISAADLAFFHARNLGNERAGHLLGSCQRNH